MPTNLNRELRQVLRKLAARPFYVAVTVLVLAVGIGANTAVFSIVDPLVLDPLPIPDADRVVRLFATDARYDVDDLPLSWQSYREVESEVDSLSGVAAFRTAGYNLAGGAEPVRVQGTEVTSEFFSLLGIPMAQGRPFDDAEVHSEQRVIVLSHAFWQSRFGASREVVGRTVSLNGEPYEIVGVAREGYTLPSPRIDLWLPLRLDAEQRQRGNFLAVIGRLAPRASPREVGEELAALAKHLAETDPEAHRGRGFRTVPIYEELYGEGFRTAVSIFLLAVVFVHLIAVINAANLLFLRAVSHEHELAVRSTLGARRWALLRLFGFEAGILSLFAAVVGVLLGWGGTRLLLLVLPPDIPRLDRVAMDGEVLVFTVVVAVITALLATLAPFVLVSRLQPARLINDHGRSGHGDRRRRRLRRSLITAEIALACVLLVASLVLIRSFEHLRRVEPGFEQQGLLTFFVSPGEGAGNDEAGRLPLLYRQLVEELEATPGVAASTFASQLPGDSAAATRFSVVGRPPPAGEEPRADLVIVGPGYFSTLGVPVDGRSFGRFDGLRTAPVAVVNRAFAERYLPADVSTSRLRFADREWQVIGIAGDLRQGGLEDPVYPTIYLFHDQIRQPLHTIAVAVRTSGASPEMLAEPVRRAVDQVDRSVPVYGVRTMERILSEDIAGTRAMSRLLAVFAVVAWLLAAAGIYGMMAQSVTQRLHEMGVRMAVGADRGSILRLVLREGATLALYGTAIGILGSLVVSRLLTNWVHGIDPFDIASVAGTAVLLSATGVAASYLAARRMATIQPASLLTSE